MGNRVVPVALAAVCAAALAACQHQSYEKLSGLPYCDDVWKVGATLPLDYQGECFLGDPDLTTPAHGRCHIFVNGDRWAAAGGLVHRAARGLHRDPAYRRALNRC